MIEQKLKKSIAQRWNEEFELLMMLPKDYKMIKNTLSNNPTVLGISFNSALVKHPNSVNLPKIFEFLIELEPSYPLTPPAFKMITTVFFKFFNSLDPLHYQIKGIYCMN